jgi:hypothetical protein
MFVKSNMSKEVTYHKSTGAIVLKPNTVTFVDDSLVTAKELKDCYGDRINIMSRETVEKIIAETAPEVAEEVIEEVKDKEEEDEGVVAGGAAPVQDPEVKEDEEDLTSNTGDEEVDDFLNGKTDKVPEGTQEITEEEALKLKEEADKEATKASKKTFPKKGQAKKATKSSKK